MPTDQILALAWLDTNSPSKRYIIFLDGVNNLSADYPPPG